MGRVFLARPRLGGRGNVTRFYNGKGKRGHLLMPVHISVSAFVQLTKASFPPSRALLFRVYTRKKTKIVIHSDAPACHSKNPEKTISQSVHAPSLTLGRCNPLPPKGPLRRKRRKGSVVQFRGKGHPIVPGKKGRGRRVMLLPRGTRERGNYGWYVAKSRDEKYQRSAISCLLNGPMGDYKGNPLMTYGEISFS